MSLLRKLYENLLLFTQKVHLMGSSVSTGWCPACIGRIGGACVTAEAAVSPPAAGVPTRDCPATDRAVGCCFRPGLLLHCLQPCFSLYCRVELADLI